MVNYFINSVFIEGRFINSVDKLPVYQLLSSQSLLPELKAIRSNARVGSNQ